MQSRWGKEISSGLYEELLERGFLKEKDIAPKGIETLSVYIDDFREIGTCRSLGMSAGPIPFTAILEYAKYREIEDKETFLYVMRRMDEGYLEGLYDIRKAEEKQNGKQTNTPHNSGNKGNGRRGRQAKGSR